MIGSLLSGIGLKIAGIAVAVLAVLAALAGVRHSGRLAERVDNLKETRRIKDDQLEAGASGPRSRDDVDQRLRDGTF